MSGGWRGCRGWRLLGRILASWLAGVMVMMMIGLSLGGSLLWVVEFMRANIFSRRCFSWCSVHDTFDIMMWKWKAIKIDQNEKNDHLYLTLVEVTQDPVSTMAVKDTHRHGYPNPLKAKDRRITTTTKLMSKEQKQKKANPSYEGTGCVGDTSHIIICQPFRTFCFTIIVIANHGSQIQIQIQIQKERTQG